MTIYVLRRATDDEVTLVRAYKDLDAARNALHLSVSFLARDDAPTHPGAAPLDEATAARYSGEWALYDARMRAYHWWTMANPVDPGATPGTEYLIEPVEYVER